MKKYVIVEEGWEYNDEYYYQPECEGYTIKSKLYSEDELDNLKIEVDRLNKEAREDKYFRQYPDGDEGDEDGDFINPFKIVEIEK
jgi:hypothetical protein